MQAALETRELRLLAPRRLAAAVVDLALVAALATFQRPLGLLFALAYAGLGDRLRRGTIGARLFRIRVVDASGAGAPSRLQSVSRNLVPLTFAVFYGYPEWGQLLGGVVLTAALAIEILILAASRCDAGLANLMSGTRVVAAARPASPNPLLARPSASA